MHRTNIYLTEEQERELDLRANRLGSTRSAVLREILDREFAKVVDPDPELRDGFAELYERYEEIVDDLFDDDPDLRIDR